MDQHLARTSGADGADRITAARIACPGAAAHVFNVGTCVRSGTCTPAHERGDVRLAVSRTRPRSSATGQGDFVMLTSISSSKTAGGCTQLPVTMHPLLVVLAVVALAGCITTNDSAPTHTVDS